MRDRRALSEHERLKDKLLAAVEGTPINELETDAELKSLAESAKATPPDFLKPAWSFVDALESPGKRVGPFEIIDVLGRGGMGVVFRAQQIEPIQREVALKIIRPELVTEAGKARFDIERSLLGRLCHSNVANILETGTSENGQPYIAMELAAGPTVTDYVTRRSLPLRQRLELFVSFCQGVSHAHARGVIHRDLKPSNILIVEENGKPVPKIIDFGIAKAVDAGMTHRLTLTDQILGTLEYVSPEVIDGGASAADVRSDVYALGAILYELVTGVPPVRLDSIRQAGANGLIKMLENAKNANIVRPSTQIENNRENSVVTASELGDLNCLILHSLEKEPDGRYQSVAELADDVLRYLRHEPISASPPTRLKSLTMFLRRNWMPMAATTAVFGVLTLGLIFSWSKYQQAEKSKAESIVARKQAEEAIELLRDSAFASRNQGHGAKSSLVKLGAQFEKLLANGHLASPKTEFELLVLLGHSYDVNGNFDAAQRTLERAYHLADQDWAGADEKFLASLKMAEHHRGQQRPKQAIQFARDAIQYANECKDARQSGQAEYLLAITLLDNGQVDEAANMFTEMLEREEIVAEVDPGIARARAQMMYSSVLLQQKKLNEGLKNAQASFHTYKTILGLSDSRTLRAGHNLAIMLGIGNQKDKSLEIFEEILPARETILGKDHPDALLTKVMLALNLAELGESERAEALYEQAIAAGDARYQDKNPIGSNASAGLANIRLAKNDFESAIELSSKGVSYAEARFGKDAWKVEIYRIRLAMAHLKAGNAETALELAAGARAKLTKALGNKHPYSIRAAETVTQAENATKAE